METPVKTKPTDSEETSTPPMPKKLPLPEILSSPKAEPSDEEISEEIVPKKIDFEREAEVNKNCDVFVDRIFKYQMQAISPILTFEDYIVEVDYDVRQKKPTKFICSVLAHLRRLGEMNNYSNIPQKYGNMKMIMERAVSYCKDNIEISNRVKIISKYQPLVNKLVDFCQMEIKSGVPTCIQSGREGWEDYHASDVPDDSFEQKYLKYKKKYLELKKQLDDKKNNKKN